ncbi:MAG: acyl-CoA thioesterase [Chlorobiota bacterium]|jgi:acyl-CoA hydrolase|nr:acyl-CoA thioesterase [Chlorobiota bacterium]QQS67559.1 MAG: acyl-CoA thioesterase [Chlorobiota bacterium]
MNDLTPRIVTDSSVEMTELVLPNDTNQLGNLLGGRLMHWIDIAAALAAMRHSRRVCVTAYVDGMSFHEPIRLGQVVILKASVNRVFKTSMEIGVRVEMEDLKEGRCAHANSAYLTFVGLDENRKPVVAPSIIISNDDEKRRWEAAGIRRDARLLSDKKIKALK